jgi:hypothetical protein
VNVFLKNLHFYKYYLHTKFQGPVINVINAVLASEIVMVATLKLPDGMKLNNSKVWRHLMELYL